MPANPRSLRLTDAYRQRVIATRERLQAQAQRTWPTIDTLDGTDWVDRMAAALTQAQTEAVRVSSAYLSAFIATETGKRGRVSIDSANYAGKSRDGRPLTESLRSPLIGTLKGLKDGLRPSEALAVGLNRAVRMVGVDYDNAHHTALMDAIASDDRFDGWQRALAGTCGACASVASGISHDPNFPVHPGCHCVAEPVVKPRYASPDDLPAGNLNDDALNAYTGQGYFDMNSWARNVPSPQPSLPPGLAEEYVKRLDAMFEQLGTFGEAQRDGVLQLFRGTRTPIEDLLPGLREGDLVGKVISENAFSSTTPTRKIAEGFARESGDIMELTVDPEIRAMKMLDQSIHGLDVAKAERVEVLLERGLTYRITGVRHEAGRRILEMRVSAF